MRLLLLILLLPSLCFGSQLPDLGSEFRSTLSVRDEELMGNYFMGQVRALGMVYPDPIVNEYLRYIGNQLTPYAALPYSNMHIKFFVVNDKSINAFAFPGGHVAVHSGLILLAQSESELAGVMAHELAHIAQQHLLRQAADSKRLMPLTIAGGIAAAVLGVPELLYPVFAGHAQVMLNHTRAHEQEADRIGIAILSKAKFDPQGLPNMFERMSMDSRYLTKPPEYLLTHPLYESRISDTKHRASTLSYKRSPSSNMFELIQMRIAVQSADKDYQLRHKSRYGEAYLMAKRGKIKPALAAMAELAQQEPENMIIQMTMAELEVQDLQYQAAKDRLEKLFALYPDSHSLLVQYLEVLLHTKQIKQAQKMLGKYKNLHPLDPIYYEFVRQVEGHLGNKLAVYEANAEWFLLHTDIGSAQKQLEFALELSAKDNKATNRIKARQKQIVELEQNLKAI